MSASRTQLVRFAAAFVAWLLVMGDVLGFVHQAAEAHEVCAEHGELVHADDTHSDPFAELREIAVDPELSGAPMRPHEEHGVADHCRACAAAHDPATFAVADPAPVQVASLRVSVVRAPVDAELPVRAIHRAAPKTSPPVA